MSDVQGILRTVQAIARHEVGKQAAPRLAIVTSVHGANGQPDHACTVRLRESEIVLPKVPIATGLIGAVGLPQENDLVVVLFLDGDMHAPVIAGRLYSDDVAPPPHGPDQVVVALPPRAETPDDQLIVTADTPGDSRSLTVALGGDVAVQVEVSDGRIALTMGDKTQVTLTQSGASDGKVEIAAGTAKITLEQDGDIAIETAGKLSLKGTEIEIAGDAGVKINGATVELN